MPFFTYDQNNSGGEFIRDDGAGICERVIVEAATAEEANERAKRIGLYFDDDGDCGCCGNRWSMTYSKGSREDLPDLTCWGRTGSAFVHYADGRIEKHETPTDEPKPDPRQEIVREVLHTWVGTTSVSAGGGRDYPVDHEDLASRILDALDEGSSRGVRWYRDVEGDLWEWTHSDWYRWVENADGRPVPGTECLTLSRANLEHEYGPLTPVTPS